MLPRTSTLAAIEAELTAMRAYAARHDWTVTWLEDSLTLVVNGRHPADNSPIRLQAEVTNYRLVPPAWSVIAPDPNSPGKNRFPASGPMPGGASSIFHSSGVICAPFSRLAFHQHGGPHADWNGPTAWLDVRGKVRATTLAEMLAQITVHLLYSPGWKA
jgi:hypothetical protein